MILGYLDAEDRAYDLNFATLRMKIRIESAGPSGGTQVVFSRTGGEERSYRLFGEADVTASVSMDHDGHLVPLLRPVEGHLHRHERGLLFIAAPSKRDPEEPSYFLVKLRAMPSAVEYFFEDQEGTEIVSIPADEILRIAEVGDSLMVSVSAANIALPKEKLAYSVELRPTARLRSLFEGMSLSPPP